MRTSRSYLLAAEDDLDAATAAQSALLNRLKHAQSLCVPAELTLDRCILNVVRADPAVSACVRRYLEAQIELNALKQDVEFFGIPGPHSFLVEGTSLRLDRDAPDGSIPWRQWVKALRDDADASAPPI